MSEKRRAKVSLSITAMVILAVVLISCLLITIRARLAQEAQYDEAVMWYQEGAYEKALPVFDSLRGYHDSIVYLARIETELEYQAAVALLANGEYEEAANKFRALGAFKKSEDKLLEARRKADAIILSASWEKANELLHLSECEEALAIFQALDRNYQYPNAKKKAEECSRFLIAPRLHVED